MIKARLLTVTEAFMAADLTTQIIIGGNLFLTLVAACCLVYSVRSVIRICRSFNEDVRNE